MSDTAAPGDPYAFEKVDEPEEQDAELHSAEHALAAPEPPADADEPVDDDPDA